MGGFYVKGKGERALPLRSSQPDRKENLPYGCGGGHAGLGEPPEQRPGGLEGPGATRGDAQAVWLEHKVTGAPSLTSLPSRLGALRCLFRAVESERCYEEGSSMIWPLIWKDSFGVSVKPRPRGPRRAGRRTWWEAGATLQETGWRPGGNSGRGPRWEPGGGH